MRIGFARLLPVLAAALSLGGCLESSQPLIDESPASDAFAKTYDVVALTGEHEGETRRIRLVRADTDLARQDYDPATKRWTDAPQHYRAAPFDGSTDQSILQQAEGPSYAYLYYRQSGTNGLVWTVDCSRLAPADRRPLTPGATSRDCRASSFAQVEDAIRAYLRTDPKPDFRLSPRGGSASDRLLSGLKDELGDIIPGRNNGEDSLGAKLKRLSTVDAQADRPGEDRDSFPGRFMAPVAQAWQAVLRGDWGGLWGTVWHSWIIFALIAFVIGVLFANRR